MEYGRSEQGHVRLCCVLRERRQRGVALRELHFVACRHVDEDNISDLETVVKNVEWNGDEGNTSEEEEEDSEENSSDELWI